MKKFCRQQDQMSEAVSRLSSQAQTDIPVLTWLRAASAAAAMVCSSCTCASRCAAVCSAIRRPSLASAQRALISASSVPRFAICAGHSSSQF